MDGVFAAACETQVKVFRIIGMDWTTAQFFTNNIHLPLCADHRAAIPAGEQNEFRVDGKIVRVRGGCFKLGG